MKVFTHIKLSSVLGLICCIGCFVACVFGMHVSYESLAPEEHSIRYADLGALPRGLSSIDKLLTDRWAGDSTARSSISNIIVYNFKGHTLYDVTTGDQHMTIPAHVTDSLPPVYEEKPAEVTVWKDSLLHDALDLETYVLDYRRIIARYDGQVSRIEWNSFYNTPLYIINLIGHDEPIYINATMRTVKAFYLTEDEVLLGVQDFCQADSVRAELMEQYDSYYVDLNKQLPLPVWKATAGNYSYYINPRTASYISYDTSDTWLFVKHHAFNHLRFLLFAKHPERWPFVQWGVLGLGLLLSFIGIVRYFKKPQ